MDKNNASHQPHSPGGSDPDNSIPLGQRLLDRPFLLLIAGLVVMLVFYTFWGLAEIAMLPEGPLP